MVVLQLSASVDGSLKRLGVECLDLLQLHCPPTHVYEKGDVFGICDRLVAEGKVKHW